MLYPGSIGIKRLKNTIALSTITLTLYINQVQDILIQETTLVVEQTEKFLPSAEYQIEIFDKIVPTLKKLEDSKFSYLLADLGLPKTIEIKENSKAVREVITRLPKISNTLRTVGKILKYTSIFLAIQIAFSIYWLAMDLVHGKQRLLTFVLILSAGLGNYYIDGLVKALI